LSINIALKRTCLNYFLVFILLLFCGDVIAQTAPVISYTTPQVYSIGATVSLTPANTGGTVPANVYGSVSTLAGTAGSAGYNNATGTAAKFNQPLTMVGDASGNLYVCDFANNAIRKITPAGVVTTFAGSATGASGFTNGTGTGATFNGPNAIAIDAGGNFYVADYSNNAIRKITSAGVVTTFATSTLNQPAGLAFNAAATTLYVTEQSGNDIKQITLAGVVSAYAGSGSTGSADGPLTSASFNNLVDLNADNAGNLFIMDYQNNEIREITGSTVSTFAGSPPPTTGGNVNATGTTARFNGPYGMAIDGANNIYIGEQNNNDIRLVTSAGVVTLFAGSSTGATGTTDGTLATALFNSPLDMYITTAGIMYLADYGNSTIRQINVSGYTISPTALPAGLSFNATTGIISGTPTTATAATTYTVTAYNYYGNSITTVTISVTNLPVISYTTPQSYAAGVAITTLPVSSTGGAVPATTYSTVSTFAAAATNISNPKGMAPDGTGNLYEADNGGNVIYMITAAGAASIIAGTGAAAELDGSGATAKFNGPTGIVYDGSTYFYIVDNGGNTIRRMLAVAPFTVLTIAGLSGTASEVDNATGTSARFNKPYGIAYDGAANLYVTDNIGSTIRKISTTAPFTVSTIAGSTSGESDNTTGISAKFNGPAGIAYDGSAYLYVTDAAGFTIRKVGTTGLFPVTTFAGTAGSSGSTNATGIAAKFNAPYGITFDASGNLIVADEGNALIRTITSGAVVTTLAGSGVPGESNAVGTLATFTAPFCVSADNSGNVFVGDNIAAASTIRKILLTGYTISPALSGGLSFTGTNGNITGTPTAGVSVPATNYTVTAYNASGNGTAIVNITIFQNFVWKGGTAGNLTTWGTSTNWAGGTVPSSADQAEIGATGQAIANLPIIPTGSTITIGSILMGTLGTKAASIEVDGTGVLNVNGDITYQSDANSLTNTAYATGFTSVTAGGTINAVNLNIIANTNLNAYTEKLTSSVTNLALSGNVALTTTFNGGTKNEDAKLTVTGGTMTLSGITTTNANALNTSTVSLSPTTTLNFTGATAFSGLSSTGTNTLTISSPTIGYSGTSNQTVYTNTAIAHSSLLTGISYQNIAFSGTGIKTVLTGSLNISGNFTNTLANNAGDYIDLTLPTVNFNGTTQSLSGGIGNGTTFYTTTFSGGGTKTLSSGLFAIANTGVVTLSGSSTLAAGTALLTLNSNATGSATIATIPSGSSITGTVKAQRYVTGGAATLYRGYRNMTSPVSSTGTTGGLIDMSYVPASTFVTGAKAGALCGTCTIGGNPSLYLYTETLPVANTSFVSGNFVGVVDISGTALTTASGNPAVIASGKSLPAGNGFFMFFRGDKVTNVPNKTVAPFAAADNVTFTSTGILNQGSITVKDWYNQASSNLSFTAATGAIAQGFHLVGNPYASSIDWNTVFTTGITLTNVDKTIYVYNTTAKTYSTFLSTSSTTGTPAGPPGGSNIIPSGQGFFVHTNATLAQLIFNESAKVSSQPATLLLNSTPPGLPIGDKHLRLQLYKDSVNIDESVLIFNQSASANYVTNEDALYLKGSGEVGLSNTSADNKALAISQLPFTKQSQAIPLNVFVAASGPYKLNLTQVVNIPKLYDIWLKDAYLKDSTNYKLTPSYSFTANTADTTTFGAKRFSLVIRQNAALAYQLLTFTATKTTGGAQLNWTTKNEDTYTLFNVQRSNDGGKTFTTLTTITSNASSAYSYLDPNPATGINKYRLQTQDVSGVTSYSSIEQLIYGGLSNNIGNINIYPNPVHDIIKLTITSSTNGAAIYNIIIMTAKGDIIRSYTTQNTAWQHDVSELEPGLHLLKVVNKNDNSVVGVAKFIKL
jgi:sugar lactone lactonase YvrE